MERRDFVVVKFDWFLHGFFFVAPMDWWISGRNLMFGIKKHGIFDVYDKKIARRDEPKFNLFSIIKGHKKI